MALGTLVFDGEPFALRRRTAEFSPYSYVANASGQPAMSLPLHWSEEGLPIGVQVVGRYGDEASLFRLAAQLEQASMNESDLTDAVITGARLVQAQMADSLCERTLFAGSDLTYADLSHANLTDANLSNTSLFRTNLHEIIDNNTIWDGSSRKLALGMDAKRLKAEQWEPTPRTGES